MVKTNPRTIRWLHITAAACMYAAFAVYLYRPYLGEFTRWRYLLPFNSAAAAMGCFLLSRRWVCCLSGTLLAGAVFGFGPFVLGLARFHPTAGLLAASTAWLLLPASRYGRDRPLVGAVLCLLPAAAIVLFFRMGVHWRLFAMPISTQVRAEDLAALAAPLVMVKRTGSLLGFYHVPVAAIVLGLVMTLKARRLGILVIFAAGAALAAWPSLYGISPTIWLVFPVLCCSVMAGEGLSGLVLAGNKDQKWLLTATAVEAVLAIAALLMAARYFQVILGLGSGYARLLVATARMFLMGAVAAGCVFAVAAAGLRLAWLRTAVLGAALAVDIFVGAKFIVDSIL
ncbi:MAG TPA: hypothetical protein ENN81_12755 [Phycisphaerales bacterium]|nr:hypothetical protein [Phycisphaerales bacterium]